jgi:zinc D-Ala-D-Ala dipeptidase
MKPYQKVPIDECHEPLVTLPPEFARVTPHPYASLGAPYGNQSPFSLREGVLERLELAQATLKKLQPDWGLQIFDAYRPVAVQQFMVDHTLQSVLAAQGQSIGKSIGKITPEDHAAALDQVYCFWARPNDNPLTPPPHSTGAAIDLTLIDQHGQPIDMGGDIDELSRRSHPEYYIGQPDTEPYDQARQILNYCMSTAGFERHYHEWWHFSWGDQLWAWLNDRRDLAKTSVARYGGVSCTN